MIVVIRASDPLCLELLLAGWVILRAYYYGHVLIYIMTIGEKL